MNVIMLAMCYKINSKKTIEYWFPSPWVSWIYWQYSSIVQKQTTKEREKSLISTSHIPNITKSIMNAKQPTLRLRKEWFKGCLITLITPKRRTRDEHKILSRVPCHRILPYAIPWMFIQTNWKEWELCLINSFFMGLLIIPFT